MEEKKDKLNCKYNGKPCRIIGKPSGFGRWTPIEFENGRHEFVPFALLEFIDGRGIETR